MDTTDICDDADVFDDTAAGELSDDELEARVLGYAAQIAVLTGRFLDYLAEFDTRGGWSGPGMGSCAQWLSWRAGMNRRTAQEHLRVAHALTGLPQIRAHLASGELSFSKARALTRVATAEREPELLNLALSSTAAQLDRFVAAMGPIDRDQHPDGTMIDTPAPIESYGSWRWNDDGSLYLTARLNPVDAAHLLTGLVRAEYDRTRTPADPDLPGTPEQGAGQTVPEHGPRDLWRHVPANPVPALIAMADTAITAITIPQIAPGAEILIHHTPAPSSPTDPGGHTRAHLDRGPALTPAQGDELSCGASIRPVGHDHPRYGTGPQLGPTLWWGRKRRMPGAALTRLIAMRDVTCQAPGCERTHHLHIHHVIPWSKGGTTDPDNLILLCGYHHRALHDGDFGIAALGKQRFRFHTPAGSELHPAPPMTRPRSWYPDQRVAHDALTPEGNGPLDLGYATEVLYAEWDRRQRLRDRAHHADQAHSAAA